MVDIPHLAVPLRTDGTGAMAVLEQDSVEDITQCCAVLLATTIGDRVEVPDYGIPELAFRTEAPLEAIAAAVEEWEPRADLDITDQPGLGGDLTTTEFLAKVRPRV